MAGSGTQQDPFQVVTYEDLCKVGTGIDNWNLDSYYIQMENIQCPTGENRHNFVPIGNYDNPFMGQYDGNDKTIENLYIDRGDTDNIGLFGRASSGVLKNISLLNVNITGRYRCGALVGYITGAGLRVDNCNSSGIIYGTFDIVGGLIGTVSSGTEQDNTIIINSHSSVTIESEGERIGGFAGQFWTGVMADNCYATGNVNGGERTGGFVGIMSTANATNCYATGEVTGIQCTGGFVGQLQISSTVENCYAAGDVNGGERTGGFVGNLISESTITNCYATNMVTGTQYTGGFVGIVIAANATDCYATGEVEGGENTGGFVGQLQESPMVENCYAEGDVDGGERTGGFVGNLILESTTINCYAIGNVTGMRLTGGFAGIMITANATDCYAEGSVNSNGNPDTGGFAGKLQESSTVENCYATGAVEGSERTGGFVGNVLDSVVLYCFWDINTSGQIASAGGTGKTTAEMQSVSTFANWNIVSIDNFNRDTPTIWFIDDGNDYPRLGWEYVPKLAIKRFKVCVDNANRLVKTSKYGVNNVWRNIKEIKCGIANAWQLVWKRAVELIRTFTTKADFDTCTFTDTVATEAGDVELATGETTGTIESPAIDLSSAIAAETSEIEYDATTVASKGKVLTFDGIDDYIDCGNSTSLNLTQAVTVEFWIYLENGFELQRNGTIFTKGRVWGDSTNYHAGIHSNKLFWDNFIGGTRNTMQLENLASLITPNTWTHVALTCDVVNGIKCIYFNGVLQYQKSTSISPLTTNTNDFLIGTPSFLVGGTNEAGAKMKLIDLRIWNKALSAQEIQENMNSEITGSEPGLVGHWMLNEGTGTTVEDSTANGNDGTINGAIWADDVETTISVQTALSTDGGETWGNWQTATSGAAIPGLTAGADVGNTKMKWKATLSTNDTAVTPKLRNVTVKLNKGM